MKVNANTLRPGNILEKDGKLWRVLKHEIITPGKGQAKIQIEMRDIVNGNKDNLSFRTQETVERATLEQKPYQFLYQNDDMFAFMNTETYEQIEVAEEVIGDGYVYLKDGMEVTIEFHEETPLGVTLPDQVDFEVSETEPVIKGQTVSSSYKPAILSNGVRAMVPPHIDAGQMITIKTEDGSYVGKVS